MRVYQLNQDDRPDSAAKVPRLKGTESAAHSLVYAEMLAMAPLLLGGLLDGFEDIVGGVGGSEEGAWTSFTVSGGLRAAVETGEPSLLLHLRLCHAGLRQTSMVVTPGE